jgi:hypothetical protein
MSERLKNKIAIIRKTSANLAASSEYQWGHMGACNCGHLAQQITFKSKAEIHNRAMTGLGDWNDQLNDYCPDSGLPFDQIVDEMMQVGFSKRELMCLEYLNDKTITSLLPKGVYLVRNRKEDVLTYLQLWADMLEQQLQSRVSEVEA